MPSYAAGDVLILLVGLKHRSGTPLEDSLEVPYGWERLGCSLDKGGYATQGISEGNTSIYAYYKIVKNGETVPAVSFSTSLSRPGSLIIDLFFGRCDSYYSTTEPKIRISFCAGGGDFTASSPHMIAMDTDCGIMSADKLCGLFVSPIHWPYAFGRFSNSFFISDGFDTGINGDYQFSLQGNYNIGGLYLSNSSVTSTATGRITSISPPIIRTQMVDGEIYARGAACVIVLGDHTKGWEEPDIFTGTGTVPKGAIQPDVNLDDSGQSSNTSIRFRIPPTETPETTAIFGFLNSGPAVEPGDLAGWTKVGSYYGGAGSYGVDVGPRRTTVYKKDSVTFGTLWLYSDYITIGSDHVMSLARRAYFSEGSFIEYDIAFGINPSKSTAWNVVANAELTLKAGDLIYIHIAANTDSIGAISNPALAADGCTFFSHGNCVNTISTSTGYDGAPRILAFSVSTAGVDPVTLTFTATSAGAASGAVSFLHLKAVDAPISQGLLYAIEDSTEDTFSCPSGTVRWETSGPMAATEDTEDAYEGRGWLYNPVATIVHGATGTGASGSTSCAPSYPSGITTADELFCFICSGASTQPTPTMPAGWTQVCTLSGGSGATYSTDVGNRRVTIFKKDVTLGTETGTVTVSLSSGNTMRAHIVRFSKSSAAAQLLMNFATAADTTHGTGWSANSGATNFDLAIGDVLAVLIAQSTDSATLSSVVCNCGGSSVGTPTARSSTAVTTGSDHRFVLYTQDMAVARSGQIAWSHTNSANASGSMAFLHLAAKSPGSLVAVEVERDGFSATGALSGGPAIGTLAASEGSVDALAAAGTVSGGVAEIEGTLVATEPATPDTFASAGDVFVKGALIVTEPATPDTFASTGDVFVKGALVVTEPATPDTFASVGDVFVKGALAATESATPDTFASAGDVFVKGALAATESATPDTFAATGTIAFAPIEGSLAAAESADTGHALGKVIVQGSLLWADQPDAFSADGGIYTFGQLAALESRDVFFCSGDVVVSGSFALSEASLDALAAFGKVFVAGHLASSETGTDALSAQGKVIFTGMLDASESATDALTASGDVIVSGSAALVEQAGDSLTSAGAVPVSGEFSASDVFDVFGSTGFIPVEGVLATQDSLDSFFAVGGAICVGTMDLVEGPDQFEATGSVPLVVTGTMVSYEGSDTALGSGQVLINGSLVAADSLDVFAAVGTPVSTGNLAAAELDQDVLQATGYLWTSGSMVAEDAPDAFSATGDVLIGGILWTAEELDDMAAAGIVPVRGDAALVDDADTLYAWGEGAVIPIRLEDVERIVDAKARVYVVRAQRRDYTVDPARRDYSVDAVRRDFVARQDFREYIVDKKKRLYTVR